MAGWIQEHNLLQFVTAGVQDSDGYVRATALSSIGKMTSCQELWTHPNMMDQIIHSAMEILKNDSEGFPRRAAISLLCHLDKSNLIQEVKHQEVYSCVAFSGKDFDWEVKIRTVEFWNNMIGRVILRGTQLRDGSDIPVYAQALYQKSRTGENLAQGSPAAQKTTEDNCLENLESLWSNQCLQSLLLNSGDYDRSVKLKACKALCDLRTQCESMGISCNFIDVRLQKCGLTGDAAALKLDSHVAFSNKGLNNDLDTVAELLEIKNLCSIFNVDKKLSEISALDYTLIFLYTLFSMDLSTLIKQLEQTTDEYVSHPESLLDDIIAWSAEPEDILVDCY